MGWTLLSHTGIGSPTANADAVTSAIDTTGANLLVVGIASYCQNLPAAVPLTDSKGNTWTSLTVYTEGTGGAGGCRYTIFYCTGTISVGPGHTFTAKGVDITGSNPEYPSINVMAWSGAALTPFDQQNGAVANVKQPGSITPTQSNELLICGIHSWQSTTPNTINSGFTVTDTENFIASTHFGSAFAYLVQNPAAAINPLWTTNNPTAHNAVAIASFKGITSPNTGNFFYFF